MADTQRSLSGATSLDSNAIYYEVSPTIICILRLYNVFVLILMVAVAFIICLVKGKEDATYYLLACNLILSCLISVVINWWYRKSELPADKYWYIFLVSSITLFQCITTMVYVFVAISEPTPTAKPTTRPTFTSPKPYTGTTITWRTINSSTLSPRPPTMPFNMESWKIPSPL